ncbi:MULTISPECIES: hypothetical protein [unclassified Microbacterium]|uniref:hypothetical protein n=1 Tax=unclassified Microbacterium TaxID=2609290 RepID=UPI0012FADFF5|nr:hypothetical protein [Microbacterium sp. MAH-37]
MTERAGAVTPHEVIAERAELQIFSGGAIAVDTQDMRVVAVQLDAVSSALGAAVAALRRAWASVADAPSLRTRADAGALWDSVARLDRTHSDAQEHAMRVRLMADAFEYADLRARQEAAGADFPVDLRRRLDMLASDPRVAEEAGAWLRAWEGNRYSGSEIAADTASWAWWLFPMVLGGPLGFLTAGAVTGGLGWGSEYAKQRGLGTIEPGERLTGRAPTVALERIVTLDPTAASVRPPKGTKEAFRRLRDNGEDQQVRIDRYTMPDGTAQYQVFIDGTDDGLNLNDSPWDMKSNVDMYLHRHMSASYEAVRQAMADAGIKSGDTIDIVGYSQGGLIGTFLAAEGDFDVRTLTTYGSPTTVALGARTLVAELRNTNEVVGGALSSNGSAGMTGSKDSFIAMRDTASSTVVGGHLPSSYEHTAELVDDSGDPRVEALRERWGELDAATKVESFAYRAHEKD